VLQIRQRGTPTHTQLEVLKCSVTWTTTLLNADVQVAQHTLCQVLGCCETGHGLVVGEDLVILRLPWQGHSDNKTPANHRQELILPDSHSVQVNELYKWFCSPHIRVNNSASYPSQDGK